MNHPLPDLLISADNSPITTWEAWQRQRPALRGQIVKTLYGGLPPVPPSLRFEWLCESVVRRWPGAPKLWSYKLHVEGGAVPYSFEVQVLFPDGEGPFPAIIAADGCWWYETEEVAQKIISQGCALVTFNRTVMARDWGGRDPGTSGWDAREGGLYEVFPSLNFGAIAAWAWGVHRAVDLLVTLPFIDAEKIAVSGHSRGGKTALLAGLTDERISLINDNASGCGGAAPTRWVPEGGETLGVILTQFPHWFGPEIHAYVGREDELPFDQHSLLACLAPRPVFMTYAADDIWSSPEGMLKSVEAARRVYALAGKEDLPAAHIREGGHSHLPEDWQAFLDFAATQGFTGPGA